MSVLKLVGANIRDIRKTKGLSQEELAEISGLHLAYISDVEQGKRNITMNSMERISNALGAEIYELFNFTHTAAVVKSDHVLNKIMQMLLECNEQDRQMAYEMLEVFLKMIKKMKEK